MHYDPLPHTTVNYHTLQGTTTHYHTLPHTTVHYHTLLHSTTHYHTLPHTATLLQATTQHPSCTTTHYRELPHSTRHYHAILHITMHYHTLQCTTTHYRTLPHTTTLYNALPNTTTHSVSCTTSHYHTPVVLCSACGAARRSRGKGRDGTGALSRDADGDAPGTCGGHGQRDRVGTGGDTLGTPGRHRGGRGPPGDAAGDTGGPAGTRGGTHGPPEGHPGGRGGLPRDTSGDGVMPLALALYPLHNRVMYALNYGLDRLDAGGNASHRKRVEKETETKFKDRANSRRPISRDTDRDGSLLQGKKRDVCRQKRALWKKYSSEPTLLCIFLQRSSCAPGKVQLRESANSPVPRTASAEAGARGRNPIRSSGPGTRGESEGRGERTRGIFEDAASRTREDLGDAARTRARSRGRKKDARRRKGTRKGHGQRP